jgi:hypothetical protein
MKTGEHKKNSKRKKVIIKKCLHCEHINESFVELERCKKCKKSHLPSQYFNKIHLNEDFKDLYEDAEEIEQKQFLKGIDIIW